MPQTQDVTGLLWAAGAVLAVDIGILLYSLQRRSLFASRWSLADVWFGMQYTVVLLILCILVQLLLLGLIFPQARLSQLDVQNLADPRTLLFFVLPSTFVQNLVFVAVPLGFVLLKYELRLEDIGLHLPPSRFEWKLGLGLGLAAMLGAQGIGWLVEQLARMFQTIPWIHQALEYERTNPVAEIVGALPGIGLFGVALAVLAIGVATPIGEEVMFRGFIFNAFKARFGAAAGIFLSALLFTVVHTYALGLIPVFCLGLFLAYIYHRVGSLWVPILIHAVNNTLSVLAAILFPTVSTGT